MTKLNAAGSALVYSTYLGGNDQEYVDWGMDVAVDAMGTAYITGMTGSPNFPTRNACLDASGNAYVTGGSEATDYPVVSPHQSAPRGSYDAVLTRIDNTSIAITARAGVARAP